MSNFRLATSFEKAAGDETLPLCQRIEFVRKANWLRVVARLTAHTASHQDSAPANAPAVFLSPGCATESFQTRPPGTALQLRSSLAAEVLGLAFVRWAPAASFDFGRANVLTFCNIDAQRAPTEADAMQIATAAFSPLSAKTIGQLQRPSISNFRLAPQYLTFGYMQRPLAVWEAQHF